MHRRLVPALIASAVLVAPLTAQEAVRAVDTTHATLIRTMKAVAADTTHAALILAMKADLRVLVQQQKHYFARHQTYADSSSRVHFTPATGGLTQVLSAGPDGWSGVLAVAGVSCGVFVGQAVAPNGAVVADGEPGCWFRRADGVLVGV